MPTIEESIEAALFGYVAEREFVEDIPLAWPNVDFTPPANGYVQVQHFVNSTTRLFLKGSAPHHRQGILQLTALTPLNAGASAATALAGQIAEQFPADLALFGDGVKVRIQRVPDVSAGDKTEDGVWWAVTIGIR